MNYFILMLSILFLMRCCDKTTNETTQKIKAVEISEKDNTTETFQKIIYAEKRVIDYDLLIDDYLIIRKFEPTLILNTKGKFRFNVLGHKISWSYDGKNYAIKITVDGKFITTKGKVTLNPVVGNDVDSLNFPNYVKQIKIYEPYNDDTLDNTIIGFLLTSEPCTGTGCAVNYQLLYDMKTGHESYFGRYRTGFDLELYTFNYDSEIDYLSKSYDWDQTNMRETTKYVMYSRTKDGEFKIFRDTKGTPYSFEHNYPYEHIYSDIDTLPQSFQEHWIEKVIKAKR